MCTAIGFVRSNITISKVYACDLTLLNATAAAEAGMYSSCFCWLDLDSQVEAVHDNVNQMLFELFLSHYQGIAFSHCQSWLTASREHTH